MTIKFLTLLITRVVLLTGAILVWKKTSIPVGICLLLSSVAIVVSGIVTLSVVTVIGPIRLIPGIWPIAQVLEFGGWIFFSLGFLGLAIKQRNK